MAIAYYAEDIELPAIKKRVVSGWVKAVAETYGKKTGDISYIFCSDEKILEVNRQYLQHDYYTGTIIHGILHLCGINDKGPGEREIMEENENRALAILPEECRG